MRISIRNTFALLLAAALSSCGGNLGDLLAGHHRKSAWLCLKAVAIDRDHVAISRSGVSQSGRRNGCLLG